MKSYFHNLSFKWKTTSILLASNFMAILLVTSGYLLYEVFEEYEAAESEMHAIANNLMVTAHGPMEFLDTEEATRTLSTLGSIPDITEAHLHTPNGTPFASYRRDSMETAAPAMLPDGIHEHGKFKVLSSALTADNTKFGQLYLKSDLSTVRRNISRSILVLVIITPAWMIFALVLGLYLQRALTGPVIRLSRMVEDITAKGDLRQRVTVDSKDEIGQLSGAFNEMLATVHIRDQELEKQLVISREAEHKALDSEANLRVEKYFTDTLITHLPAFFILLDRNMCIRRTNQYTTNLFDLDVGKIEASCTNIRDYLGVEETGEFEDSFKEAFDSGVKDFEMTLQSKRKTPMSFIFHAVRMAEETEPLILVVGIDVSERHKLEEELRQAQKMEMVGQLAGGVAHDFNNILQAIMGFMEMAKISPDGRERDDLLEQSLDASERAAEVTRQLLAFGRKQRLQMESTSFNKLLEDFSKMIQRLIGTHISLVIEPCSTEPHILCDRTQMEQVLMNLCVNARDAMPDGGSIIIRLRTVSIDDEFCLSHAGAIPGDYAVLTVADTGNGIDRDILDRIFEPFFTTKGIGEGTGLGLSVVYGIICEHNGVIDVNTQAGKGTTFSIYLPQKANEGQKGANNMTTEQHQGTGTVLMAEDESAITKSTKMFLEKAGYHVILASNGLEAVKIFETRQDEINLVLMDVNMPKLNGVEAFRKIRKINTHVPVIFCTGNVDVVYKHFEKDTPMMSVLQKPFRPAFLLAHINKVINEVAQSH